MSAIERRQIDDSPYLHVLFTQFEVFTLFGHAVVLDLITLLKLRPHVRP